MSLPSILLVLDEQDRIRAGEAFTATVSRHLASAAKWSDKAGGKLSRFQKQMRKRSAPAARQSARIPYSEIRQFLGIPV